ncbi:MAG: YdcF family protein, partial [Clostridia bacterium]|nr:YdcF family protein [Clostridia bacterium]
ALFLIFISVINLIVVFGAGKVTEGNEEYTIDKKYDAIVVLGAGLRSDGTPSNMLEDRLKGAIELYKKGIAPKIILSGDCSGEDYDEVSAMQKYCVDNGVADGDIVRDDNGFSTYETMENIVNKMGYKRIIVVTQKYHIYRSVYIARRMGAEADGFSTDYRDYIFFAQRKRDVREFAARIKDFFKVNFDK